MQFHKAGVAQFLEIFDANREAIRNSTGCTHLELLQDLDSDLIYTTLSHWRDAESLEHYRQSILFASVWGRVKRLFSERPQAFSLVEAVSGEG